MVILLSPFAPHICEELWSLAGNSQSISFAEFPEYKEEYTVENSCEYPISFNGKVRFKLTLSKQISQEEAMAAVMAEPQTARWLEGKTIRKLIVVPGRIINVVI